MHPVVSLRVCKDIFNKSKRWNLLLLLSFFVITRSVFLLFSNAHARPIIEGAELNIANAYSPHLLYTSGRGVVLLEAAACDLVRVQESKKTEPSDK